MTIELGLSLAMMFIAIPVSQSITWHYVAFAAVNLALLGVTEADSSLLAMIFGLLAIIDYILFAASKRIVLILSASASVALCLESIGNGDWLLNHVTYLSIATNALIIGTLVKEYWAWIRGKSLH